MATSSTIDIDSLIGHQAAYECTECGGPEPAASHAGCDNCGAQGDIVPRGTVVRRRLAAVETITEATTALLLQVVADPRPRGTTAYEAQLGGG
ncbi:MAG: hypothetical protein ABSE77_17625 [Acidimicrobiales bacterium]|jgi:hypothetical protein